MTLSPATTTVEESLASGLTYARETGRNPHGPDILMLHGLGGDERSMFALRTTLGAYRNLISPRGLFEAPGGGYSWVHPEASPPADEQAFSEAVSALCALLSELRRERQVNPSQLILMGFSQGSAAAFALAGRMPSCLGRSPAGLVAIAGFLPRGELPELRDIPVYWGHGSRDLLIPVATAQGAVQRLQRAGVAIQYCEADVGHKLGVECTRGLRAWIRQHFNSSS